MYDEKRAELTLQEAAAISKDVKTFELLLGELTELESRIQHSAEQSTSVCVGFHPCMLQSCPLLS